MKPIVSLLATALLLGWTAFADTIAEWNFNNAAAQTTPSAGVGTLGPIGGITVSAAASGVGSSDPETAPAPDNAYQTTGYPAAAVGDRTSITAARTRPAASSPCCIRWMAPPSSKALSRTF
jgi:hypothetical protein